jgi:hypothetical protein
MTAKRGANGRDNLKKSQDKRKEDYKGRIARALAKAVKTKLEFRTYGALVTFVTGETGIGGTTFTRNRGPEYREMLSTYLATQTRAVDIVSIEDAPPELLRAKVIALQNRLRDKTAELERLKLKGAVIQTDKPALANERVAFVDTAKLLYLVIKRSGNAFEMDVDRKEIIDRMAAYKDRVVASPPRTDAFFAWLRFQVGSK